MFGWFGELSKAERRTFWACFGGWALDALDVQVYSFAIPALVALWHITNTQAGALGTAALITSSIGGWLAGLLSDRFGRVRMLQVTVAWFALFTFLSGLTHSFDQLLVTRSLQGLGFGGEWATGSVLMGEVIRREHRGKAVGFVQSAWAVGWALAALLYTVLFALLDQALAWRLMFILGIVPALLVVFIRRFVDEPELSTATRQKVAERGGGGFLEIFSPRLLPTTILVALLSTGAMGGYYAITIWLPTYLKTVRHLSVFNTGSYLMVVIVGSFLGYLVSAHLTDLIGRRLNFLLFAVCSALAVVAYTYLPIGNRAMLVLGFPLGFFASGIFSGMGPFMTELFPSRVRGSGQGFCYNFGRALGALFPTLVGRLSASMSLAGAIGLFAGISYAIIVLAALALPETRGRELAVYD